jgi:hypothetical protein
MRESMLEDPRIRNFVTELPDRLRTMQREGIPKAGPRIVRDGEDDLDGVFTEIAAAAAGFRSEVPRVLRGSPKTARPWKSTVGALRRHFRTEAAHVVWQAFVRALTKVLDASAITVSVDGTNVSAVRELEASDRSDGDAEAALTQIERASAALGGGASRLFSGALAPRSTNASNLLRLFASLQGADSFTRTYETLLEGIAGLPVSIGRLTELRRANRRHAGEPFAQNMIGWMLRDKGRIDLALTCFEGSAIGLEHRVAPAINGVLAAATVGDGARLRWFLDVLEREISLRRDAAETARSGVLCARPEELAGLRKFRSESRSLFEMLGGAT